jgi:hypothetical protein
MCDFDMLERTLYVPRETNNVLFKQNQYQGLIVLEHGKNLHIGMNDS